MLFLNGPPPVMIWGPVFSCMEGRRTTEVLGAILLPLLLVSVWVLGQSPPPNRRREAPAANRPAS